MIKNHDLLSWFFLCLSQKIHKNPHTMEYKIVTVREKVKVDAKPRVTTNAKRQTTRQYSGEKQIINQILFKSINLIPKN